MSDGQDDARPEAVITLPRSRVKDMMAALLRRCQALEVDRTRPLESTYEHRLLTAAGTECYEMLCELSWHYEHHKPYRYVVPLTAEEAHVIDEELNRGTDTTNP